jgi:dynein heavy chain
MGLLSKDYIRPRHWEAVMEVVGSSWSLDKDTFYVSTLLDAGIMAFTEDVADICEAAEKQAGIESKLADVKRKWATTDFTFVRTTRDVPMLSGHATVMEDLEESQLILQTMLSMRHVAPFREAVTTTLAHLSDAVDTLEVWIKVQLVCQ